MKKDIKNLNKFTSDFIVSSRGQLDYPGMNTLIPNANGRITMKGVKQNVLGIDDLGNKKIMKPKGEYQFPGDSVYEIPLKKKGGEFKKGLVTNPKKTKKSLASKKYSRSLSATNVLFTENSLFKKPKSRKNKVYNPKAKYYAEGGESEQKIIFSPREGGCPEGQYWTGTECKIIPKNTKIIYSEEELAKSNISKKEQQKLYNQYISRVNNHNTIEAAILKKYGKIGAKDKYYKTFESIPKHGFSPMMSYGTGTLIENGLGLGIPSLKESMIGFNEWKQMMDKSSVKPIGFKGHPGGGHFYPIYEKPSNYLLGYNKEEEPIKEEEIENLPLLKPGLIDPTKDELQGNTLNEEELELPNEEVESEYLEEGSPDTENAMEWVNKRKYNIDWNGIQIPYRLPRFRKPGSYGDLIKPGKKRYINLPTIESRNTAYLREEQDGGDTGCPNGQVWSKKDKRCIDLPIFGNSLNSEPFIKSTNLNNALDIKPLNSFSDFGKIKPKKIPVVEDSFLETLEKDINDFLDNPLKKAAQVSESLKEKGEDPSDALRHSTAGALTAQTIANKTGNIPFISNPLGYLGANIAGIGHELSTLSQAYLDDRPWSVKLQESLEDIYNNSAGANTIFNNNSEKDKINYLLKLTRTNQLPDGYGEERPFRDNPKWTDPYNQKQYGGINKFDGGGTIYTVKGSDGNYKKINGQWQVDWNRSGKYQPLSKGDVKARTAILDKMAKPVDDGMSKISSNSSDNTKLNLYQKEIPWEFSKKYKGDILAQNKKNKEDAINYRAKNTISNQDFDKDNHISTEFPKNATASDYGQRIWEYATNPGTALEYAFGKKSGQGPMPFNINQLKEQGVNVNSNSNLVGNMFNMINPLDDVESIRSGVSDIYEGNNSGYLNAGLGVLGFLPGGDALKGFKKYVNNKYTNIAEGSNMFDYAWKSPAARFDEKALKTYTDAGDIIATEMPQSTALFDKLKTNPNLTAEELAIIKDYEASSITYKNGPNKEKLDAIIKKSGLIIDEPTVMSRRINTTRTDNFNPVNGIFNTKRPTSWSAGRDAVGNMAYSGSADRMVMKLQPGEYDMLKNPYLENSPETLDELIKMYEPMGSLEHRMQFVTGKPRIAEREILLGSGTDLKQIGKVKNNFGGFDYIMKNLNKKQDGGENENPPDKVQDLNEVTVYENQEKRKLQGSLIDRLKQIKKAYNDHRVNLGLEKQKQSAEGTSSIISLKDQIQSYKKELNEEKKSYDKASKALNVLKKYNPESYKKAKVSDILNSTGVDDLRNLYKEGKISDATFMDFYDNFGKLYDREATRTTEEDQVKLEDSWYGKPDEEGRTRWMGNPNNVSKVAQAVAIGAPLTAAYPIMAPAIGATLAVPEISGGLNAYFGYHGLKEFGNEDSHTRKSMSRAYDDPTGSNMGDAAWDVSMNLLNFVGLPFSKAFKGTKNLIKGYKQVPKQLPGSPNQEELVDLWRIQERGARPMAELATEGKLGKHFQNEKAIKHFKDREEHFGQWFTKDKNDFDFYNADREFIDPEIINLKVPKSKLDNYSNYNKSLSSAPDREFVIPYDQQSLYKVPLNTKMGSGLGIDMSKYEIKNPDYYTQLLNTYDNKTLSSTNKKFYKDLINTVKKQNGILTERQYNELQRLKNGNFNFGKKGYANGGATNDYVNDLTPEEIQKYIDGGYIVEEIN